MARTRIITNKLIEQLEDGALDWEEVCRECLQYMSEDDVADMANTNGYLDTIAEEDYDS